MTASEAMIQAKDLAKSFGSTRAVDGITFDVSRGEVVGFLGPNGAGKTTTMRIITGYLRPTGGSVKVAGTPVADDPLATRQRIGYLPESAPLYDEMMVLDFLEFTSQMRGVPADTRRSRLKEICERCGLMDVLGKDIGKLSKGFRQRVGLAQAMVHDPDVLILDEPTSGLDPNQIVEIRELIRDLGREKTVILSTHILPEVQATCSRVLIISDGKLVADDTPEGLTDREAGAVVSVVVTPKNGAVLEADRVQALFSELPGVRAVEAVSTDEGENALAYRLKTQGKDDPRPRVFRAAVENDLVLLDLHREQASLEETFRRLTRGEGGRNE